MANSFVEVREANHEDHICVAGCTIGKGDQYKREAIPPWAFKYRDETGQLVDEGEGLWVVIKKCFDCLGGADGFQETLGSVW